MRSPQKWNRYADVRNNPINPTDPTGRDENFDDPQVAVVVNNSKQTIWIGFDADGMGPGGANLDARIPLKPGEFSKYTPDTDAVIVGPGQKIEGETKAHSKCVGVRSRSRKTRKAISRCRARLNANSIRRRDMMRSQNNGRSQRTIRVSRLTRAARKNIVARDG